jgi:hypothetical protein
LSEGRVRVIVIAHENRPKPAPRRVTFGWLGSGAVSKVENFGSPDTEWHKEWDSVSADCDL